MKILIINGPNLNLLGTRNPEVYGSTSFEDFLKTLQQNNLELTYFQSNVEGELINAIQAADADGIILNAGGYTHTSVAIRDCVEAVSTPVVEVHISNIAARESFRHESLISPVCIGCIFGFGLDGYRLAVDYFTRIFNK
jgi:3-dehydroquinate dehydratase II